MKKGGHVEKIEIEEKQRESLESELFDFYKSVKEEGRLFADFKNLEKLVENPKKVIQNFLDKNFSTK